MSPQEHHDNSELRLPATWNRNTVLDFCLQGKKLKQFDIDDLDDAVENFSEMFNNADVPSTCVVDAFQLFSLGLGRAVEKHINNEHKRSTQLVDDKLCDLQAESQNVQEALEQLRISQENLTIAREDIEDTEIQLATISADYKDEIMKLKEEISSLKITLVEKELDFRRLRLPDAVAVPTQQATVNESQRTIDGMKASDWLSMASSTYDVTSGRNLDRVVQNRLDMINGTNKVGEHAPSVKEELEYFQKTRRRLNIRNCERDNTSARTMKQALSVKKNFDKYIAPEGKTFDTMSSDDIVKKFIDMTLDQSPDNKRSSATMGKKLQMVERLLKTQGRFTSVMIDRLRKDTFNTTNAESKKDKASKKMNATIPMTHKDLLHMANVVIQSSETHPYIDFEMLQSFTAMQISNQTARRYSEVFTISLQSLKVRHRTIKKKCGTPVRVTLVYLNFCEMKQKGFSDRWKDVLISYDGMPIEQNAPLWLLLCLQYRGLIKSALDVLNGDETLNLSPDECETAKDLKAALKHGRRRYNYAAILTAENVNTENSYRNEDKFDSVTNEDLERVKAGCNFDEWTHQLRLRHGKLTMWTNTYNGIALSTPMNESRFRCTISKFAKVMGYTSDFANMFGITSFRKGFIMNVLNAPDGTNEFRDAFLDAHCENGGKIRSSRYYDRDRQRQALPGGIYCHRFDEEIRKEIVKDAQVPAAYEQDGYFKGEAITRKIDMTATTFLANFGGPHDDPVVSICSPLASADVVRTCPFAKCRLTFGYRPYDTHGDYMKHIALCPHQDLNSAFCDCGKYNLTPESKLVHRKKELLRHNRIFCDNTKRFLRSTSTTSKEERLQKGCHLKQGYYSSAPRNSFEMPVRREDCPVQAFTEANTASSEVIAARSSLPTLSEASAAPALKPPAKTNKRKQEIKANSEPSYVRAPIISVGLDVKCEGCSKRFKSRDILNRHRRQNARCAESVAKSNNTARADAFIHNLEIIKKFMKENQNRLPSAGEIWAPANGAKIAIGRWLARKHQQYRQQCPTLTEHHIQAFRDIGVIWAHYPPNTDLSHVQFIDDCRRIKLYVSLFATKGCQVPHNFVCPVTAQRVGPWIKRIKNDMKTKGDSFPQHRLELLKAIGLDPERYSALRLLHKQSFSRVQILSAIRQHRNNGQPGFEKVHFNAKDLYDMDKYDTTGVVPTPSTKLNPNFHEVLASLGPTVVQQPESTDDPFDYDSFVKQPDHQLVQCQALAGILSSLLLTANCINVHLTSCIKQKHKLAASYLFRPRYRCRDQSDLLWRCWEQGQPSPSPSLSPSLHCLSER